MKKKTFLKKFRYRRKNWNSIINTVIDKGLDNEIISVNWCLKDVISHVTWYEKEIINAIKVKSIVEIEFFNMTIDDRNDLIFKNTHEQNLDDVLKESNSIYDNLIYEIEKLTDEELNSDTSIKRKSDKRIAHDFIAGNTFYHYEDHEDALIERFDLNY
ncbi:MAG: DinB family protein [Candidatus Hodarchaeales archaeon]